MLPEVGMSELVVIAIVALIVVGPKDLPVLLRRFGQFMAKLRGMASEFRASFDEMARQSELDDLRKEVEAMRRGQFADIASSAGGTEVAQTVSEIEASMADVGVQLHPPMSYQYDTTEAPPPPVEISDAPKTAKKPRAAKAATATPKAAAPKAASKAKAKTAVKTETIAKAPKPRTKKTAGADS
jgi:sec-independent protein translocase protein TatB